MQQDAWHQIAPVLVSIFVLIAVAAIRNYSRTLAAITATTPVTIPLALWIVYTGAKGDRATVSQFASGLPLGITGTAAFTIAVWLAARAGWKLGPIIAVGYLVWGITIGLMLVLRRWLGL